MPSQPRRARRAVLFYFACTVLLISLPAWAAEKTRLRVDDYQIDAEFSPHVHKLTARAKVKIHRRRRYERCHLRTCTMLCASRRFSTPPTSR